MTKTFKLGTIFFISVLWLVLVRIAVNFITFSDNVTSWLFSFLVQVIGMGLIPVVLYKQWIKDGNIREDFHLNKDIHPLNYVLAIIIGIVLYYLTMGVSIIYQNILIGLGFTHVTGSVGTIYSGWEVLAMQIITVAVLPAFFEEFIDRGLLMSVFSHEEDDKRVIVILAIIFALSHQNITQTGYTVVGGLVIAFMAVKTRSIWPGVIIHFINNGISVVLDYSTQKKLLLGIWYNKFQHYMSHNILIIIATWIGAGFLIAYLLRLAARLNLKSQTTKKSKPREVSESIYRLFGDLAPQEIVVPPKPRFWEYGMVLASVVLAFLTTIFTFIWGVLR